MPGPKTPKRRKAAKRTAAKKKPLSLLGGPSALPSSPEDAVLETFPNPHRDAAFCVRFTVPEFTSLCPITGQPDFAHLLIDIVPRATMIESKALKLFLGAFRNHGAFHEDCTIYIAKRIVQAVRPRWLRIGGYWYPRGGIPIDVFYQTGAAPSGVWIPPIEVMSYRGRG
jgi:7-cyano-7-deazaguanine reductase